MEISAEQITCFNPSAEQFITGIDEFREYLLSFNGTFSFPAYELQNPKIRWFGNTGILNFNFVGYTEDCKKEKWNTSEVNHFIQEG